MARLGFGFRAATRRRTGVDSLALAQQISSHGVTFTFASARPLGQYANGDWWVLGPVSITSITPASTLHDGISGPLAGSGGARPAYTGRVVHGTMVNPGNRAFAAGGLLSNNRTNTVQGWDGLTLGGLVSPPYSAAANVDPGATGSPLVVTTGSVVKFVSRLTGLPTNNRPAGNDMVVLTVVDAIPASDAIRPGVSRGGSKASAIRLSDFNLDVFQNLPPTPNAPTFAQALDWVDRYHEVSQPDSINNTRTKGINNHREYGRDIGNDLHRAMLCLHLSSLTVGQKRTLLSHLATIADDLISRAEEGSVTLGAGGGDQWKLPVIYVCAASLGAKTPASWAIHLGSAQRFNWAENSQVFTVQGTDTAMPRLSTDGRPRAMYTPQMIGTADWGEQHSLAPQNSGANWNAFYRDIVAYSLLPGVLAVELTAGAKVLWNYPALWLYFDTVFGRRNEGGTGNQALPFTLEMVNAYRPAKTAAPALVEAGVRGVDLWLRFDQSLLDNVNAPAPTAFTILVGGSPRAAVAAQVFRQNIGLTLVSPVLGSDVVSISYNLPGANPVRSVDGVNVASWTPAITATLAAR